MLILARCVGLLIVSGLLTCWDKIIGKLTRVEYLKTEQFLSELSVPLLMHSESQARDRGRKRPRPQETEAARDRGGKRLTVLWGFANPDLGSSERQATRRGKAKR